MLFALLQGPLELLVGGLELLRLSIELCVGLASTRWSGSRGKILPSLEALLQIALLVVLLALLCVVSLVCAPIFGAQGTGLRRSRLLMLCSMRFFLGILSVILVILEKETLFLGVPFPSRSGNATSIFSRASRRYPAFAGAL